MGLPVVISNCSNNYGPYHFPEKLIPLVILNALEGKPLPVYGDGSNVRDWLYVEDHARALHLIAHARAARREIQRRRPQRAHQPGGGRGICDTLDRLVPAGRRRRRLITFVADRPGHDHRYAIDAGKLERELGWRAARDVRHGLGRDRALVSRQPRLVGAAAQGRLCRRASRAAFGRSALKAHHRQQPSRWAHAPSQWFSRR